MSHEIATVKKGQDGLWRLTYGAGTPKAGQDLPNSSAFLSAEDAQQHAIARSIMSGRPTDLLTPDMKEINFGGLFLQPKSNMPKGGSLSPKGDLGALRRKEARKVFKKFKGDMNG